MLLGDKSSLTKIPPVSNIPTAVVLFFMTLDREHLQQPPEWAKRKLVVDGREGVPQLVLLFV